MTSPEHLQPSLPATLETPIPAVRVGTHSDEAVSVVGFGRYPNGTPYARYELRGNAFTAPLWRIDFNRLGR